MIKTSCITSSLFLAAGLHVSAADAPAPWVKVDVPFVPTPPLVVEAMLKIASVGTK